MVDLSLMYRILKVFDRRPLKVVSIGDRGQLPPIGPGLVFHKMIESSVFPLVELKTNYRTLSGSTIPEIAEIIRNGETFRTSKNVILIESRKDVADEVVAQYLQHYQDGETVQIISATKRVMAQATAGCKRSCSRTLQSFLVRPNLGLALKLSIGEMIGFWDL